MFIWWLASMVLVVYGKRIPEKLILDLQNDAQPEKDDFMKTLQDELESLSQEELLLRNRIEKDDKSQWTEVEINEHNRFTGTEEKWEHKTKRGAGKFITKWPEENGKLIIPYVIDSTIPVSTIKYNRLVAFIGQMNNIIKCNPNTWRLRTNEPHYVQFTNSTGCSSFVGKVGKSPQNVNLADGCVLYNSGTVLHEMMHAMGFYHEQSRYDRDQYVTIKFENIRTGRERNFKKVEIKELNSPYDYGSVMHYGAMAFSKNGLPTIVRKITSDGTTMGQRNGLSESDKKQLNDFYGCTVPTTQPPTNSPTESPTNPPTDPPTNPPINPPTKQPTDSPTDPPTNPPTDPPTNPPTDPPTNPPTNPPTIPPTESPTNSPTEPPTNLPTESPTNPPTNPPTEPPTNSPTEPPTNPPTDPPTNPPTNPSTQPPTTTPIRIEGCDFRSRHHDCFRRGFSVIEDEACKDKHFGCSWYYRRCRWSKRLRMYCPKTCKQCVSNDYLTLQKYTKRVRTCLKRKKSWWGRHRCVKWQQKFVALSSHIRTHIEEDIIEDKLNCQCQSGTTCDKVNFCVSFSYRRRPTSGAIGKQSTIGVCLVNPEEDEGYAHRHYNKQRGQICTESNTQMLTKAATFEQWRNASFHFKGECRNIEMTLNATKGSDDIDIKHVTIYGGDCPAEPLGTNDEQVKTDQKRTVLSSKMAQLKDELEGLRMSVQKLDLHE